MAPNSSGHIRPRLNFFLKIQAYLLLFILEQFLILCHPLTAHWLLPKKNFPLIPSSFSRHLSGDNNQGRTTLTHLFSLSLNRMASL